MLRRSIAPLTVGLALCAMPLAAHAQSDEVFVYGRPTDQLAFDLQLFEPSTSPRSITTVDLGTVADHMTFTVGAWSSYASRLLVVSDTENGQIVPGTARPLVSHIWQTELQASLGLFGYMEAGLAVPLVETGHVGLVDSNGTQQLDLSQGAPMHEDFRIGDLRGYLKVPILRGAWPVAVRVGATFPINGDDAFAGNIAWTLTPMLMASHEFGALTAAINLGYRFRERNGLAGALPFVLDDEFLWSVGLRYALTQHVSVNAEVIGRVGVSYGSPTWNRTPIDVLVGGLYQMSDSLGIQLGVVRGLTSGYGAPEFQVYGGVRIAIAKSRCTTGPEDYDGYQDGDFCRDPDNDADGVPDSDDRCPNDAEDIDGFQDQDGCPDPDNDADGILDPDDRCPMDPEDYDGFEDTDGCPDNDNDRDGRPDNVDQCPMEPEDLDGYEDDDGCPEPGPEAAVVTRTESHLLLSQRVFFDYDSDTIRSVSLPILNAVARTLRDNTDITRIRVEGYTDGHGDAQYNLDLSYRRARAVVEYLASQGIPREHLEFQGYGSTHPVADDSTPEGQALNRRVEFTILGQGGQRTTPTPANGAPHPTGAPAHRRHHH